jgi:hypothetical protein
MQWMLRMGLPWFLKRCKDLFPGVGYLLILETSKDVMRAVRKRRNLSEESALAEPRLLRQASVRKLDAAA